MWLHYIIQNYQVPLDIDNSKLLDRESRWFQRGVREALRIHSGSPSLNRDRGRHQLPPSTTPLSGLVTQVWLLLHHVTTFRADENWRLKASHFQTLFLGVVGLNSLYYYEVPHSKYTVVYLADQHVLSFCNRKCFSHWNILIVYISSIYTTYISVQYKNYSSKLWIAITQVFTKQGIVNHHMWLYQYTECMINLLLPGRYQQDSQCVRLSSLLGSQYAIHEYSYFWQIWKIAATLHFSCSQSMSPIIA